MTTKTLVHAKAEGEHRWALLLYPQEDKARSKVNGADEGVILLDAAWARGGGGALRRLRSSRASGSALWSFDVSTFTEKFHHYLELLPGAPAAIPYQIRRGAPGNNS
eukprot:11201811-Lingulodinium_polyedra.AAC.1